MTNAEKAAQTLRDQFAAAKVEPPQIIVSEDDYIGDGICGSVTVDELTLHPFLVSDGEIGWGSIKRLWFPVATPFPTVIQGIQTM
jgi:hypothetical protein